jgi:hypothetical protein
MSTNTFIWNIKIMTNHAFSLHIFLLNNMYSYSCIKQCVLIVSLRQCISPEKKHKITLHWFDLPSA